MSGDILGHGAALQNLCPMADFALIEQGQILHSLTKDIKATTGGL